MYVTIEVFYWKKCRIKCNTRFKRVKRRNEKSKFVRKLTGKVFIMMQKNFLYQLQKPLKIQVKKDVEKTDFGTEAIIEMKDVIFSDEVIYF